MAVLNQNVIRTATRNLVLTSSMRDAVRPLLDAEYAAASAMTDDVFWGYDSAWFTEPAKARFLDLKQSGMGGGGGRNISFNNNQFWDIQEPCSRQVFSLLLFQQRRYMAAQIRLRRLLASAPQPQVVAGFDRYAANSSIGVRAACGGVSPRDAATAWAYWIQDVLRVVGVARWATNFTWSDGTQTCRDFPAQPAAYIGVRPVGGAQAGCDYVPDCGSDQYGVPRAGYIAGRTPTGTLRFVTLPGPKQYNELGQPVITRDDVAAGRLPHYMRSSYTKRESLGLGLTADGQGYPLSVAPAVLGLHRNDTSDPSPAAVIPTDVDAFRPMLRTQMTRSRERMAPIAVGLPDFLRQPDLNVDSYLVEAMTEWPEIFSEDGDAWSQILRLREQTGFWVWHDRDKRYRASAGSELLIWRTIAMARDIVEMPFGQVIIDGFDNLDATLKAFPPEWRTGPMSDALAAITAAAQQLHAARAEVVGAAMSGAAAVATAVLPIAGVIVGVLGAAATALTRFQLELGLTRVANPPVLQCPSARVSSIGDDRCWLNPGPDETLAAYEVRVTSPYAEAARRAGGDPGRLFDLIPEVRSEQYCQRNPQDPRCQQAPVTASRPWPLLAIGSAVGFGIVKLLGG